MTIKEVSETYDISPDTLRYYERAGMIPPVTRTPGGIRDYQEQDIQWVLLAKCMRSAGLPVETMAEYLKLCQQGDATIPARLQLLKNQREIILEQRRKMDETLERINYKIAWYETAVETGTFSWEEKSKTEEKKNGKEGRV